MPTARAPREKVGSGGTRSHKEMKKWEECTSHFTQQTVDYGVVIAIYHPPLNLLQFVLKGCTYHICKALYHGRQASSSILTAC